MSFVRTPFDALLLAIDLCVFASASAALWVLLRRASQTARSGATLAALHDLARAGLYGTAPWAAFSLWLGGIVGFMLLSRTLWTMATVWVPAASAWLALRNGTRTLWLAAAVLLGAKYYGEVWEPSRLEVSRLTVPIAGLASPVRIAHLSDLQTDGIGAMHMAAREAANAFEPDVVVFTGDVANHESVLPEAAGYLAGFRRLKAAYYVTGNVDDVAGLAGAMAGAGYRLLDGRGETLAVGRAKAAFLGLGLEDFADRTLLRRLAAGAAGADVKVLLSHVPDAMFIAQDQPVDLLLAGHTHGGQVCLPWFGPIVTLSSVPRRIGAGGLHRAGRLWVHVSRGLGWEGFIAPRVRLFCRPHLALIELVPPS